jgi:diaminopimelate decarboxylase
MGTFFHYKGAELHCERTSLAEVAREYGTPCYVYSAERIVKNYRAFDEAFSPLPHLIAYAVKANSNGAILRLLAQEGSGADVVSKGELTHTLQAGILPGRIVFAGVGKHKEELRFALEAGILLINVESQEELESLARIVEQREASAQIAVRVNPAVDVGTHPYLTTGRKENKFGVPIDEALNLYHWGMKRPGIAAAGVHMHLGSQIVNLSPYPEAVDRLLSAIVEPLEAEGIAIEYFDIGGGLGIPYAGEFVPGPLDLAQAVLPKLAKWEGTLVVEPGRAIVGDTGVLLTEVLYRKSTPFHSFLIVDAGMNDFLRPALYHARHRVQPVIKKQGAETVWEVVGPVCESADILSAACSLPSTESGDVLAIMNAGAYGFSMASTYNSRPRPAEVLVKDDEAFLIRAREDIGDLTAHERIPHFLK